VNVISAESSKIYNFRGARNIPNGGFPVVLLSHFKSALMFRSQINPLPEYFDRYINMTDDVTVVEAIQISLEEIDQFPVDRWKALGDKVYAPGKWTIKDILQHIIDTERVFTYRILAATRGEKRQLPPYDEDIYAANAHAGRRNLDDLITELRLVRQSFLMMYQSFTPEMMLCTYKGVNGEYAVGAMGFMIPGHQRWHLRILEERYYHL
jgi:DinB superfamily